jgi:hypothetical protein
MKRALVVALLCGCSSPPNPTPDSGTPDSGMMDVTQFNVTGTAAMFPEGAAMLADAGLPTSVAGLRMRVEEPFKIAINDNDPLGIFSAAYLDAGGEFSAQDVQVDLVTLGVAGGIRDDSDAGRVIRSATTIWDVALEGKKPDHDLTGTKAWAIPTPYHDALTAAISPAEIRSITGDAGTLIEAGFILGRIVDASGNGVAGATLTPTSSVSGKFYYPLNPLIGTGGTTSNTGLFVYVHNGGDVETFRVNVTGRTEYKTRQAGAAANACLVLTIYPGAAAP